MTLWWLSFRAIHAVGVWERELRRRCGAYLRSIEGRSLARLVGATSLTGPSHEQHKRRNRRERLNVAKEKGSNEGKLGPGGPHNAIAGAPWGSTVPISFLRATKTSSLGLMSFHPAPFRRKRPATIRLHRAPQPLSHIKSFYSSSDSGNVPYRSRNSLTASISIRIPKEATLPKQPATLSNPSPVWTVYNRKSSGE